MESRTFVSMLHLLEIALIDCAGEFAALPLFQNESLSVSRAVLRSLLQIVTSVRASSWLLGQLADGVIDIVEAFQSRKCYEVEASYKKEVLTSLVSAMISRYEKEDESTKGVLYLLLLQLLQLGCVNTLTCSYFHKGEPAVPYFQLFTAVYALLPSLLAMLARDVSSQDAGCSSAAASLLLLCLTHDDEGTVTQYVLQTTGVLMALLSSLDQLELSQLESSQRLYHQSFLLLLTLSHTTFGAMTLLQHSLFGYITHCPLLASLRNPESLVALNALSPSQKKALREVLKLVLQLALSVECSVRSIRAVNVELLSIVLALSPLTSFLFKDRENEDELFLEVLGLYLGVLQGVANNREKTLEMLNGYENVLKNEVVSLLNYVSKLERVCRSINANVKKGVEFSDSKQKEVLYLVIVENGMLFMSKMGWKIGDEYLRAFGVKN